MLLHGINHVATLTGDSARLHAFYREVFEANVVSDTERNRRRGGSPSLVHRHR